MTQKKKKKKDVYPPIELKDIQNLIRHILDFTHLLNIRFTNIYHGRCTPENEKIISLKTSWIPGIKLITCIKRKRGWISWNDSSSLRELIAILKHLKLGLCIKI